MTKRLDTIEIVEGRYFARYWFFGGVDFDWLAALWRDPDGPWTIQYRFRYVVDDRFDGESEDEKSWWAATLPAETEEAAAEALVHELAAQIRETRSRFQIAVGGPACSELQSVPFHSSSMEKNFATLARQPWCHVTPTQKGGSA